MRPIDFCTPKPFQLEHSCSAVSQRSDRPVRCASFVARHRGPLSSRNPSAPCSFARTSLFARSPLVRRRARQAPVGSGPSDANEAGENLASRRDSRFGDRRCSREGVFFRRVSSIPTAADTPVASSAPYAWLRFSSNLQAFARRPPRPVPRGPRERRALCRSRVPSADRHDAHPARAEARTKPRSLHRRRGAHVMRIAELR
jgi:hypothetical protein